ncbi:MAG TPA: hypothetical protein VF820_02930 [Patescibacteria group bacterium]
MREAIIKNKDRSTTFLLLGILSLLLLIFLIKTISPSFVITLSMFHISIIIPFFVLFFFAVAGILGFILASKIQGIIIGSFLALYLIIRLLGLTSLFFLLLLFLLFIVVEMFFLKAK